MDERDSKIESNMVDQNESQNDNQEMELSNDFINNFKSMYYALNATPDTQMKIFNKGKIIKLDDIKELCRKVAEKMDNHDTILDQVTIHISFDDGRNEKLSLPEFNRKDFKISAATKTISINWNFYVKLPNYDMPQRHSLTVRMGSRLRPDEFFKIMLESDNDAEIDMMMSDLVCRVDFVNALLADELINRVEEWYNSLEEDHQESKWMKFIHKNSMKINKLIEFTAPIIAIIIIYIWTKYYLNTHNVSGIMDSSEKLSGLLLWFVISFILIWVLKYIGYYIASSNHRKAKSFLIYSHMIITNGDNNRRKSARAKNNSTLKEILVNTTGAIVVTIITTIWGFFI